jgi:Zn-dependent protease with chaperone function
VSVGILTTVVILAALPALHVMTRLMMTVPARSNHATACARARALFARAVVPSALALGAAGGVLLPAFLLFEPPYGGERPGLTLWVAAAAGAGQLVAIAWRAARMLRVSQRLVSAWHRQSTPLDAESWGLPASTIDKGFPVVAVSGLLRPQLFIDRSVINACSPRELEAIAAHERAHVRSRDNLRRLLIGACRGPSSADACAWRHAAEQAADEGAATSPACAVELASALLKIARLAPPLSLHAAALSTIHDGGSLEARVQRLLAVDQRQPAVTPSRASSFFTVGVLMASALAVGATVPLLRSAHALLELFVRHLP